MWSGRYQQVGIPLVWGVALIGAEVFLLLSLRAPSCWLLEALTPRILVIGACFAIELTLSKPEPYPLQAVSESDKRIFPYSGRYSGGQLEYLRVPYADVGPMKVPDGLSDEQVLFLSDIFHGCRFPNVRCVVAGRKPDTRRSPSDKKHLWLKV